MSTKLTKISFGEKSVKLELREEHLNKASKVNFKDEKETLNSLSLIRKLKNPKSASLTLNSKLDEQDVFASLIYSSLKQIDKNIASSYLNRLETIFSAVSKEGSENSMLKAARRALYKLVKERKLANGAAKIIRRVVVGKSNLDGDVTSLLTKRVEGAKETPVRAVKTILSKIKENLRATEIEFKNYSNNLVRD